MPLDHEANKADYALLEELGKEAGAIALKWFNKDPQVWMKEGDSPVSEADFAVDEFLKENMLKARPDYGWLSEESEDNKARLSAERVFVVDPIDGTRGFINGMKQWCVSIAVVENHRPVVGILQCPVLEQTLMARAGGGAFCNGERLQQLDKEDKASSLRVTGPRSVQTKVDQKWPAALDKIPFVPSLAYRIAMVAMGDVDLALARGSAKDWDLAAADLIAFETGACLSDMQGQMLRYNCGDIRHGALIACAQYRHNKMLELAKQALE